MGSDSPSPKYRTPVFMSPELVGWPQIYCTLSFWRNIVCMWSVARSLRPSLPLMLRPIYNIHSSSTSVQPPLPRSLAPTPLLQKRCIHSGPDGSVFPSPSLLSLSLSPICHPSFLLQAVCVYPLFRPGNGAACSGLPEALPFIAARSLFLSPLTPGLRWKRVRGCVFGAFRLPCFLEESGVKWNRRH